MFKHKFPAIKNKIQKLYLECFVSKSILICYKIGYLITYKVRDLFECLCHINIKKLIETAPEEVNISEQSYIQYSRNTRGHNYLKGNMILKNTEVLYINCTLVFSFIHVWTRFPFLKKTLWAVFFQYDCISSSLLDPENTVGNDQLWIKNQTGLPCALKVETAPVRNCLSALLSY